MCVCTFVISYPMQPGTFTYSSSICLFSITSSKVGTQTNVDPRGAFRMAVWLTVYYDFFDKNVRHLILV